MIEFVNTRPRSSDDEMAQTEHILSVAGFDINERDDWDIAEIDRLYRANFPDHLPHNMGVNDGGAVWFDNDVWSKDQARQNGDDASKATGDILAFEIAEDPEAWTR